MTSLDFSGLLEAIRARQKEWDPDNKCSLLYHSNELAGEAGEACNEIKKLERERMGMRGSRTTKAKAAEELADVIICTVKLAAALNIDLAAAVVAKFNATSEQNGFRTKLPYIAKEPVKCGTCRSCSIELIGCGCDGAEDDGCFYCTPSQYARPPCPPTAIPGVHLFSCEYDECPGCWPVDPIVSSSVWKSWVESNAAITATHRCKVCSALWEFVPPRDGPYQKTFPDGFWSLRSSTCGSCCDNAPMGDQIEELKNG